MSGTLSISGSPAYRVARLRSVLLGWKTHVSALVVLMIVAVLSVSADKVMPFALTLSVVIFLRHISQLYLDAHLAAAEAGLPEASHPEDMLAADLVQRLGGGTQVTVSDLVRACIQSPRGIFMLRELAIGGEALTVLTSQLEEQIDIRDLVTSAYSSAIAHGEKRADASHILEKILLSASACTELLHEADVSEEDVKGLLRWEEFHHRFQKHDAVFSPDAIRRSSTMGRSWVTGYTDELDALTTEIDCHPHLTGERSIVIHRQSIQDALRTLTRNRQRNILLLGAPGVGKKTMVRNLACALRSVEQESHMMFTRVLVLQTEKLLSGVGDPAAFFYTAMARARSSGRIALVVQDLSTFMRSAGENLRAVFLKCLESDSVSVIGIADTRDYHAMIKQDAGFDVNFEKITVEDSTDEETMAVLMAHFFALERRVHVTYKALKAIIELSKRYLGAQGGFPGKAIDVMDEAIVRASDHGHAHVTEEHVRETVSAKSKVNVTRMNEGERDRLLNLESVLRGRIIGQDPAIKAVSGALKRARVDLADRKRPVGTYLFLGPTGVGKTQTAKTLAQEYFGSSEAMIRLDMNEFSHPDSVGAITGSATSEGFLTQRVQDKPFSLILLDEIEKAHPAVLNLFLQILDEGFLTDARGIRTDFRNTIIIATSNAGALFIRDFVREHQNFGKEEFKAAVVETILREKLFAPEFINRFDETILFQPLSLESVREVAMLMLGEIIGDISKRRGISVKMDEAVVDMLVQRGYSAEFGAREMRRVITDTIEDYLAEYMLRHNVKRGETILIHLEDLQKG